MNDALAHLRATDVFVCPLCTCSTIELYLGEYCPECGFDVLSYILDKPVRASRPRGGA